MFDNEVHRVSSGRHLCQYRLPVHNIPRGARLVDIDEAIAHLDIVECMTAVRKLLLE